MAQMQFIINLKENVSKFISSASSGFKDLRAQTQKVTGQTKQYADLLGKISTIEFSNILSMADQGVQSLSRLTQEGVSFEQSMADLSAITGIVGDDLSSLEQQARKVGAASGLGAAQAATAYKVLASNIDVATIGMKGLNTLQDRTVVLAQASGLSIDESAQALSGTINQFGLQADEASRVINVLAAGAKYGAAEIPELAQSFKVVGASANAAGISMEMTAGALEVLSKNNLKGAEAGTAMRNMIVKLQTELNYDFTKTSLSQALTDLQPKLTDVTFLAQTFGAENITAAQYLIANAQAVEEMTGRLRDTNVAMEQAETRTATTAHQMEVMRATIDDFKISMFALTGGVTGYMAIAGENLVQLSQLIPLFSGVASAVSYLTKVENLKGIALKAATAAQWLYNAAMTANPIGVVIVGIAALTAGIIYAWKNSEKFRSIILGLWESFKALIGSIGTLGKAILSLLSGDFKGAVALAKQAGSDIVDAYQQGAKKGAKVLLQAEAPAGGVDMVADAITLTPGVINIDEKSKKKSKPVRLEADFILEYQEKLSSATEIAKLFGNSQEVVKMKMDLLKSTIEQMINEGIKPNSKAVLQLKGEYDQLSAAVSESQYMVDYQNRLAEATKINALFGNSQELVTTKMDLLKSTIEQMIRGGIDPQSEAVNRLINAYKKLHAEASTTKGINTTKSKAALEDAALAAQHFHREYQLLSTQIINASVALDTLQASGRGSGVGTALLNQEILKLNNGLQELQFKASVVEQALSGINNAITNLATDSVVTLMESLGSVISGDMGFGGLLEAIGVQFAGFLSSVGKMLIEMGIKMSAMKNALKVLLTNPYIAIAVGAGLVLAGALMSSAFTQKSQGSIPKFANGGIVSGATLALVGEYAGAANNPEVIAPLSKLKSMINPAGISGEVRFEIEADKLIGVLNRAGKRTKSFG